MNGSLKWAHVSYPLAVEVHRKNMLYKVTPEGLQAIPSNRQIKGKTNFLRTWESLRCTNVIGVDCYRKDRHCVKRGKGGGVLLYV